MKKKKRRGDRKEGGVKTAVSLSVRTSVATRATKGEREERERRANGEGERASENVQAEKKTKQTYHCGNINTSLSSLFSPFLFLLSFLYYAVVTARALSRFRPSAFLCGPSALHCDHKAALCHTDHPLSLSLPLSLFSDSRGAPRRAGQCQTRSSRAHPQKSRLSRE